MFSDSEICPHGFTIYDCNICQKIKYARPSEMPVEDFRARDFEISGLKVKENSNNPLDKSSFKNPYSLENRLNEFAKPRSIDKFASNIDFIPINPQKEISGEIKVENTNFKDPVKIIDPKKQFLTKKY
jgi:hypothetical protein